MEIKLYKLWNSETGKFNAGGDHWTSKGKCWNQKNHLTTKLTQYAMSQTSFFTYSGYPSPSLQLTRKERDYYRATENRQALYQRFIPDSWVVIEITNNGVRELCKARDWLSHK